MALVGTHIRFAHELADALAISNYIEYISGTLYPDSRYFTGVDRLLTHPRDAVEELLRGDDFKKGWAVHLMCDKLQREFTRAQMPEVFAGQDGQLSDVWVRHSALKMLQDIVDVRAFEILEHLDDCKMTQAPFGESAEPLERYYAVAKTIYRTPAALTIETASQIWREFSIEEEYVARIRVQAQVYADDPQAQVLLRRIFDEMVVQGWAWLGNDSQKS